MGINKPQIGVLAVQGAFIEHERILKSLGAEVFEIRQLRDLNRHLDGLVLPGGESTVQGKLLHDLGLFEPLRKKIVEGLPVLATCAGAILLADAPRDYPPQCLRSATRQLLHRKRSRARRKGPADLYSRALL